MLSLILEYVLRSSQATQHMHTSFTAPKSATVVVNDSFKFSTAPKNSVFAQPKSLSWGQRYSALFYCILSVSYINFHLCNTFICISTWSHIWQESIVINRTASGSCMKSISFVTARSCWGSHKRRKSFTPHFKGLTHF